MFSFLSLPPEIRNSIYKYLFLHGAIIDHNFRRRPLNLHPKILETCSLIHNEASKILYSNTLKVDLYLAQDKDDITLDTYIPEDEFTDGPKLREAKRKLKLQFISRFRSLSITLRCYEVADFFIVRPQVLELCEVLMTMNIMSLEIRLRSGSPQDGWEILLPFNQLRIPKVKIFGGQETYVMMKKMKLLDF